MRIGVVAENMLERLANAFNLIPRPALETLPALLLARSILSATKLGVFEALVEAPLTVGEVAARCSTNARATEKLLNALVGARYLRIVRGRYALTSETRKWLLRGSEHSMHDLMLQWEAAEWHWVTRCDEYLTTGQPIRMHSELSEEQWELYQRGMRAAAAGAAREIAHQVPMPEGAREMLDIGGSHGLNSVAICRLHPGLRSTILDLPDAVAKAAPLLAREGMGDRVVHRAGDVLAEDLGVERYDVVFTANVLHHFDDPTNRELARRVARALRKGGYYVICDFIRPDVPGKQQVVALLDFFFALTSASGTWSFDEMASWQRDAGLVPARPVGLRMALGSGLLSARKPAK